jgi:hypothetical protein
VSEHTAAAALDSMLITGMPDEEFGWEMLGLLEACDFDYELWCRVMGTEPDSQVSESAYARTHADWARAWIREGDMFHVKLEPIVAKWRRLLGQKVKL